MPIRTKVIIGIVVVVLISAIVWANINYQRKETVTVQTQNVERRNLTARVSASGRIQTTRKVDVSASISGKVIQLAVEEGQYVTEGELLLRIDPTPTQTAVSQLEASIRSAQATLTLNEANLNQARIELERQQELLSRDVIAEELVQRARSTYDVEVARRAGSVQEIARLDASLRNAKHDLTKVNVHSDISGVVTVLNIREGENAFVGTFNNPGTILMTVSNLSHMEAWVEVDETDVVDLRIGQPAEILVDAYPDTVFNGAIERIGHSPIAQAGGASDQESINFEVVIVMTDSIPNVRPGLSCVADIITGVRSNALAIPIQSLTVRTSESETDESSDDDSPNLTRRRDRSSEGVFVVENEMAIFRHVTTGLTGERRFEVLSGIDEEMVVVTGPFEILRTMKDSALVKIEDKKDEVE
ncbi:MAG: efflux RND transporter periplasmic adaptor subunit [Candidatus Latescibacteria bacterium]|jgi:HlyD family secretion protein|nr:efflux RND transporter periplasmic adaptor subunit [Candidatus Latescibacterota bacterium]